VLLNLVLLDRVLDCHLLEQEKQFGCCSYIVSFYSHIDKTAVLPLWEIKWCSSRGIMQHTQMCMGMVAQWLVKVLWPPAAHANNAITHGDVATWHTVLQKQCSWGFHIAVSSGKA